MKTQILFLCFVLCSCQKSEAGNLQINNWGWLIILLCITLLIVGFYNERDKLFNADEEAVNKEPNLNSFVYIGTYIGGFKNYPTRLPLIFLSPKKKSLHFFYYSSEKNFGPLFLEEATLPIGLITDVKCISNNKLHRLIKAGEIPSTYVSEINNLKYDPDAYIVISNKQNPDPLLFAFYDSDATVNYEYVVDFLHSICDEFNKDNNQKNDKGDSNLTMTNKEEKSKKKTDTVLHS